MKTPITSCPARTKSAAATLLSTPPDMAITIRDTEIPQPASLLQTTRRNNREVRTKRVDRQSYEYRSAILFAAKLSVALSRGCSSAR